MSDNFEIIEEALRYLARVQGRPFKKRADALAALASLREERERCDERLTELEKQRTEAAHAQITAEAELKVAQDFINHMDMKYRYEEWRQQHGSATS